MEMQPYEHIGILSETDINYYRSYGYNYYDILDVSRKAKSKDDAYNMMIRLPHRPQGEDYDMEQAIEASMKDQQPTSKKYDIEDFETPEERVRKEGIPVGLKNVGNSKII